MASKLDLAGRLHPPTIGAEFDHLATERPDFDPPWRTTVPTKKAAVVTIMRDEGLVILEWVAHYRALGFDTLFVYTNDNIDGSDALLLALDDAGIIRLIWNAVPPDHSAQFKAYRHAFWHNADLWEHEWATFLDADEFLIPRIDGEAAPIGPFLDHIAASCGASSISLNWRWFPGNGEFAHAPGLLCERFRHAFWQKNVKTLFRLRAATDIHVHHVDLRDGLAVNGNGVPRAGSPHEPPAWRLGHINHYWNRSFQEFYVKRQRGRSAFDRTPRDWSLFFHWQGEATPEPSPDATHVARLYADIDALRRLPGVAEAERTILASFHQRVASPDLRTLYEEARNQPNTRPPIAWPT